MRVARKLAQLLAAGCSLAAVNRKLKGLARLLPGVARPLADPAVVVEGRRLFVRRDEGLSEPTGQLLIDFDAAKPQTEGDVAGEDGPVAIPMVAGEALHKPSARRAERILTRPKTCGHWRRSWREPVGRSRP